MKHKLALIPMALLAGFMTVANAETTATPMTKPIQHGENMVVKSSTKAKVTNINYKSREVTLQTMDGEKVSFIAGPAIKNLNEVKIGDTVFADYSEAIVYDINKGGTASKMSESMSTTSSRPGTTPSGTAERKIQASVIISEINRSEPSVTVKDSTGAATTFKVQHPEKLEGVKVGDRVDLTYTEAMAMRVERADKKQR